MKAELLRKEISSAKLFKPIVNIKWILLTAECFLFSRESVKASFPIFSEKQKSPAKGRTSFDAFCGPGEIRTLVQTRN